MKKIYLTALLLAVSFSALFLAYPTRVDAADTGVSQAAEAGSPALDGKVLVAYFTRPEKGIDASSGASRVVENGKLYGNTEYVARIIAEATHGDLFAIETTKSYPDGHDALIAEAKREAEAGERPVLATRIERLDDYDIIFVGYPNWWYDMPMPIYTFFETYDFKVKTIIPFCTHGGSRFSQSVQTITDMEKGARVVQGPAISRQSVPDSRKSIEGWLQRQSLLRD